MAACFAAKNPKAEVELTQGSKDKGVDIFLRYPKTGKVEIVQCKRYRAKVKVSSPDMQKFAGAMYTSRASKGYFVTTSDFNTFALEIATTIPDEVELVSGRKVAKMLNECMGLI